ncbi:MAG: ABC transporter ATP-binding protein [Nitrospinae bacterium]|nr:ABC transporter ATP-binding protein [Nitrospinota bacterium]
MEVSLKIFEAKEVGYSYTGKIKALHGVSLAVEGGEKIAILGANGCGKSTFLKILDGLIFPDTGEVNAFGERLSEESLKGGFNRLFRSRVALLFQNPDAQLFSSSVRDEIAFGPLQLDLPRDEIILRVEDTMKLLRIEHLRARSPHELSIGEKRKVAIASLLTVNPDVLLLDEPTAGLDPRSTRELINILMEANEAGKTIITATHDLHIVPEIADRCYVFSEEKKIAAEGKTEDILSDMALLKECNLIHIHSHKHNEAWHSHPHGH